MLRTLNYVVLMTLAFAVFHLNKVLFIQADQQWHNRYVNEAMFPIQIVPVSSVTTEIKYTMWTPNNWTTSNRGNNSTAPKLQYNTYLLSTTNSKAFQVIVPFMSSSSVTTKTMNKIAPNKNNDYRVERYGDTCTNASPSPNSDFH